MLRYGQGEEGMCGFADRDRFRFFLYWREQKKEIDLPRDRERFLKQQEKSAPTKALAPPPEEWVGGEMVRGERIVRQYGRFFSEARRVVTAVFTRPAGEGDDESETKQILDSISITQRKTKEAQEWRVADLQCLAPLDHPLQEAIFQPAKTVLTFRRNAKKEPVFQAGRHGLVSEWLGGKDLETWLKRQTPPGFSPETIRRATVNEHHFIGLTARGRHRWFPLLRNPRRFFEMVAWVCPVDDALYTVSRQLARPESSWENPATLPLRCCPEGPGRDCLPT